MEKLNIFKKTLSCVMSAALTFALVSVYPKTTGKNANNASAQSIAEMQEQINANKGKISELQAQLDELAGNKAENQQYQAVLNEQISVIQNNINLLNQELETLNNDINSAQENIGNLNQAIDNQQQAIDDKVELFKKRLCAMYVSGNDNLASVVVGTSSFYDMMSRVEMVNRIATYDEELINDILGEIDNMEADKKQLESEKLTLEMKVSEQTKRKEEKAAEMDNLTEKMHQTQAEIDRIAQEEALAADQKAELEAANAEFNNKIEEIIAAQAAAAQAAYEAEQQRLAQERAAANAAAAQQAAQQGQSYTPTYTEPSYIPAPSASGFAWPAPGCCYISSTYGPRWGSFHGGIDVGDAGIHGRAATASKSGTVVYVYNSCSYDYPKNAGCPCGGCGNYGNHVIISHDGTYSTVYAHLASACVSVGQHVEQGQTIGYIGCTGWSTGAHLHFEVRVNGNRVDPLGYVSP
ncbi:MAG: peptidoglycan DD-metalloendopeptidase family protein [Ruminococcus sp.]|uniref:murein hydrolase activator EnvC family protein n=1 Tax=Ruminococcus sp. TaxID=41978 RepID=UPI0025CF07A6|nr:M23 family metallopeptidase [Ruminococcus sp.]MCR5599257.1 peptidoglycan DD-metalloendopeptidase family protein [Ruminococcus sp.]